METKMAQFWKKDPMGIIESKKKRKKNLFLKKQ